MKMFLGFALVVFSAVSAMGAERALITKSSGGGHVHPEWGGMESCEVFQNKVIVSHQFGFTGPTAVKVVEIKKVNLGGDLKAIIALAEKEAITEKPNFMCDGPHTGISARGANEEAVLLFSTGGCGNPNKRRDGLAASKLTQIVDLFCPQTYTGGIEG